MNTQNLPVGLDGFQPFIDPTGKHWYLRTFEGWEIFVRPTGNANPEAFPMQLIDPKDAVLNFGVSLTDESPKGDGWELRTNSQELADIVLGKRDEFPEEGVKLESVEQLPPWNRLPEPSVRLDVSGVILPIVIIVSAFLLALGLRRRK